MGSSPAAQRSAAPAVDTETGECRPAEVAADERRVQLAPVTRPLRGTLLAVLLLVAGCSGGFSQDDIDQAVADALAEQAASAAPTPSAPTTAEAKQVTSCR